MAASKAPTMGAAVRGPTQVVISPAQESMKARAARAGFRKFLPMPPKSCLTKTMAKKSPMRRIQ